MPSKSPDEDVLSAAEQVMREEGNELGALCTCVPINGAIRNPCQVGTPILEPKTLSFYNDGSIDALNDHGAISCKGARELLSKLSIQQAEHQKSIGVLLERLEHNITKAIEDALLGNRSIMPSNPPGFALLPIRHRESSQSKAAISIGSPLHQLLPHQVPDDDASAKLNGFPFIDTSWARKTTATQDSVIAQDSVTSIDTFESERRYSSPTTSRSMRGQTVPHWLTDEAERKPLNQTTVDDHLNALKKMKTQVQKGGFKTRPSEAESQTSRKSAWSRTPPRVDTRLYTGLFKVVKDRRFEILICIFIITNAVVIGVEGHWEMDNPASDPPIFFRIVNVFFFFAFTIELILRIAVESTEFFAWYNPRVGWNMFDTVLVVVAIIEEVVQLFTDSTTDMSALRVLRTMRIVRGFRIVRVFAFFRDLRIMVAGILYSLYSLVWAILLLVSMMYLFSVCLLQFAIDEHVSQVKQDASSITLNQGDYADILQYFGGLDKTIYTLYCSIVGGIDWADAARPLLKLNPILGVLYSFYVAFAVLCVLNIITGVFVENANRTTAQDDEMVMMEQMEQRGKWFEEVKELFEAADTDHSGRLDKEEFTKQMQDLRMQAWFRKIGVHVESYSATGLFQLLDFDNDGKLDLDEFAMALHQVHGHARSIDVAKLDKEVRSTRREIMAHVTAQTDLCTAFFQTMYKSLNLSPTGTLDFIDMQEC